MHVLHCLLCILLNLYVLFMKLEASSSKLFIPPFLNSDYEMQLLKVIWSKHCPVTRLHLWNQCKDWNISQFTSVSMLSYCLYPADLFHSFQENIENRPFISKINDNWGSFSRLWTSFKNWIQDGKKSLKVRQSVKFGSNQNYIEVWEEHVDFD